VPDIVVVGGGGHANVLISVLRKCGYNVLGYTDNLDRGLVLGAPYLGNDEILLNIIAQNARCNAAIGVGKVDGSATRKVLQEEIAQMGFALPPIVAPSAIVSESTTVGDGTLVLDGVVVNCGAVIDNGCILNTNCTVEHDCNIGENVHVAPGAIVCGGTSVGSNCMIGAGATVIQSVRICDGCLIGAGATVTADITSQGTYVGNPARRIR
jgi:sugar O-acyltransferase (sialic acid O-acetyltransferase NeuD family)